MSAVATAGLLLLATLAALALEGAGLPTAWRMRSRPSGGGAACDLSLIFLDSEPICDAVLGGVVDNGYGAEVCVSLSGGVFTAEYTLDGSTNAAFQDCQFHVAGNPEDIPGRRTPIPGQFGGECVINTARDACTCTFPVSAVEFSAGDSSGTCCGGTAVAATHLALVDQTTGEDLDTAYSGSIPIGGRFATGLGLPILCNCDPTCGDICEGVFVATQTCNNELGECETTSTAECDDSNPCTVNDCEGGVCDYTVPDEGAFDMSMEGAACCTTADCATPEVGEILCSNGNPLVEGVCECDVSEGKCCDESDCDDPPSECQKVTCDGECGLTDSNIYNGAELNGDCCSTSDCPPTQFCDATAPDPGKCMCDVDKCPAGDSCKKPICKADGTCGFMARSLFSDSEAGEECCTTDDCATPPIGALICSEEDPLVEGDCECDVSDGKCCSTGDCSGGNVCRKPVCKPDGTCDFEPLNPFSDVPGGGDCCRSEDCSGSLQCDLTSGGPVGTCKCLADMDCDDGVSCTLDKCLDDGSCESTPKDSMCPGPRCTDTGGVGALETYSCDETLDCVPSTSPCPCGCADDSSCVPESMCCVPEVGVGPLGTSCCVDDDCFDGSCESGVCACPASECQKEVSAPGGARVCEFQCDCGLQCQGGECANVDCPVCTACVSDADCSGGTCDTERGECVGPEPCPTGTDCIPDDGTTGPGICVESGICGARKDALCDEVFLVHGNNQRSKCCPSTSGCVKTTLGLGPNSVCSTNCGDCTGVVSGDGSGIPITFCSFAETMSSVCTSTPDLQLPRCIEVLQDSGNNGGRDSLCSGEGDGYDGLACCDGDRGEATTGDNVPVTCDENLASPC